MRRRRIALPTLALVPTPSVVSDLCVICDACVYCMEDCSICMIDERICTCLCHVREHAFARTRDQASWALKTRLALTGNLMPVVASLVVLALPTLIRSCMAERKRHGGTMRAISSRRLGKKRRKWLTW